MVIRILGVSDDVVWEYPNEQNEHTTMNMLRASQYIDRTGISDVEETIIPKHHSSGQGGQRSPRASLAWVLHILIKYMCNTLYICA